MTTIIKGDFGRRRTNTSASGTKEKPAPIYQLKISLAFSSPLIWRRLLIPGETSLARLHNIFQQCMGWDDIHSHRFLVGKVFYAPSEDGEIWERTGERDESAYRLVELESDMKWCFTYIYDFSDGWEHDIELEEIIPRSRDLNLPTLLAGDRACPPENVGGIPGYEEFLTIINDPRHKHHQKMAKWYGTDRFDPDFFDAAEINRTLQTNPVVTRQPG
jgi:Plasmid pRiA4b ORF-3-like protein